MCKKLEILLAAQLSCLGWHISAFQACVRPLLQIDGGVSTIFDGSFAAAKALGPAPKPPVV